MLNQCYEVLRQTPDDADFLNTVAWIRATSPLEDIRNIPEAIDMATRACQITKYSQAGCMDALGTALAQQGQFDQAIEITRKALAISTQNPQLEAFNEELEKHVALYQQKKAYSIPIGIAAGAQPVSTP